MYTLKLFKQSVWSLLFTKNVLLASSFDKSLVKCDFTQDDGDAFMMHSMDL